MADSNESDSEYDFASDESLPELAPVPAGEVARAPAPVAAPPVPDRLCPHCGFSVFGKMAKNRCPECSGDLSASNDLFQFSTPAWTRSVATGLFVLVPAVLLHCVAMTMTWSSDDKLPGALCHFVAALLALVGAWMAGSEERRSNVSSLPTRWPMRFLALCSLALTVVFTIVAAANHGGPVMVLAVANLIVLAAFGLATGLHIRALAYRMPNDSLLWWSQNLSWLVPFVALFQILFNVAGRVKAEFLMLFMCSIPMAGGFSVIALAAAWTLFRAGMEMRTCATAAEAIVVRRMKRWEADKARQQR
jgi:hypothetical protein